MVEAVTHLSYIRSIIFSYKLFGNFIHAWMTLVSFHILLKTGFLKYRSILYSSLRIRGTIVGSLSSLKSTSNIVQESSIRNFCNKNLSWTFKTKTNYSLYKTINQFIVFQRFDVVESK